MSTVYLLIGWYGSVCVMQSGFEELQKVVPSLADTQQPSGKHSKCTMLLKSTYTVSRTSTRFTNVSGV